jgi:predicted nucleotidyltransferase
MDDLRARILAALADIAGIDTLLLFGSRAGDEPRPDSDLDVALLTHLAGDRERRRLQSEAAAALADLSPGGRVDVVLLDEAPELLRQRIMERGQVLRCDRPAAWRALRVRTMREHGDRESVRELMASAQKRRLSGEADRARP